MSDNPATHHQAFHLLCGKKLGIGMSRTVYECKIDPHYVVKVEDGSGQFQNVVEWETWQRVADTNYSRWFARCKWISDNGAILIMERTTPATGNQYLDQMPVFLCDFKRTNYGMVSAPDRFGQSKTKPKSWLVCHDYGTSLLFEYGMTKRMRKANWYDAK